MGFILRMRQKLSGAPVAGNIVKGRTIVSVYDKDDGVYPKLFVDPDSLIPKKSYALAEFDSVDGIPLQDEFWGKVVGVEEAVSATSLGVRNVSLELSGGKVVKVPAHNISKFIPTPIF